MMTIDQYLHASSLQEAYDTLTGVPGSAVLGGCAYLRMGSKRITTGIDLSKLSLDGVTRTDIGIEIGAMTPLRKLETDPLVSTAFGGVLARAVSSIVGVQLRNVVTVGGTVAGRFPFSDLLTALLALDAQVVLFQGGSVSLASFMDGKSVKDIVVKIVIPDVGQRAAFGSIRNSATDYAIVNCAVAVENGVYRVVVGARPGKAVRVPEAEAVLSAGGITAETAVEAGKIAGETLEFGDNLRGSAEYRKAVVPVLVKRTVLEVQNAG